MLALETKETEIAWTDNTKKLIYTILSLPVTSADAERGFSHMNHIHSLRRNRLNSTTMISKNDRSRNMRKSGLTVVTIEQMIEIQKPHD